MGCYFRSGLLCILLGFFASEKVLAKVTVHDIRLWRAPDSTRVVFDLDQATSHTLQTLSNPSRIVIDIPNGIVTVNLQKLQFTNMPIKSIRSQPQANGDLRMVLDLSQDVNAKSFFLKKAPPLDDRLVLDLIDTKPMTEADDLESLLGNTTNKPQVPATQQPATVVANKPVASVAAIAVNATARPQGRRDLIIAIDAGHGGEDPGAIGASKIREKDVVLAIANKVKDNFNRQQGYKAILVRKGDYYVGLSQRRDIARKANADLFVSIHADAFTKPQANGGSVFALSSSGATSATAQFLADKENQSDLAGGVSLDNKDAVLSSVLVDLSMTYKMEASLDVGIGVLRKMANVTRLHNNRVEQAAFAVLKTPDIPSILVETGFISNHAEAKKLSTPAYQQKMADAVYQGIHEYFLRKAPEDSYIASFKSKQKPEMVHQVSKGETLSWIAIRYSVSIKTLVDYNRLNSTSVRIGQKIKIPAQ